MGLLQDSLAPITNEIGFIESPAPSAIAEFIAWQESVGRKVGTHLIQRAVSGSLFEVLRLLEPLKGRARSRYLFIPTASNWTTFFDNGKAGTDAFGVCSFLAKRMGCRGARIAASSEVPIRNGIGQCGSAIFGLYGPNPGHFLNYIRSVALSNDGGTWAFSQGGAPLPGESLVRYEDPSVRDRFSHDDLGRLASLVGLHPFDEHFYRPEHAVLVSVETPQRDDEAGFSLDEIRQKRGLDKVVG